MTCVTLLVLTAKLIMKLDSFFGDRVACANPADQISKTSDLHHGN